jgi:hypothetical protein
MLRDSATGNSLVLADHPFRQVRGFQEGGARVAGPPLRVEDIRCDLMDCLFAMHANLGARLHIVCR